MGGTEYQMEVSFSVQRTNYTGVIVYHLTILEGYECNTGGQGKVIAITIPASQTVSGSAHRICATSLSITPKWELSLYTGPTSCTNTATVNDRNIPL